MPVNNNNNNDENKTHAGFLTPERQMYRKIWSGAVDFGRNNMQKPSLSFFLLSLPLALCPRLERWVDEGLNFFEILSIEL